ncbi:MAG: DUF1499 domain-containing protein [bacterium]|nr:DUF1499 domain-containing protein [bacterium]
MSPVPTKLGVFWGYFKPCPESPNCVSSQATREEQKIAPLSFVGTDRPTAYKLLREVISEMPRSDVLVSREDYVHVEFQTKWLRFRDDTEFSLNDTTGTIEVRSASRIGTNDGGVNRKRVEEIRTRFNEKLQKLIKG